MNATSIIILKQVISGVEDTKTIMERSGVKEWQFNSQVNGLSLQGFLQKTGNSLKLLDGVKPMMVKEISTRFDIEKILKDSNELVFSYLTEPTTINDIVRITGLSTSTVYRTISDFESIGILSRNADTVSLNNSDEKILLLSQVLKTERENMYEPNAEIIFRDATKILKSVTKGKITDGQLTGFSIFSDYGIEYHTNYDYYIKQEESITIQEALIHAVFIAQRNSDKTAMIMAIIFYLKNKDKMDILTLRKIADSFKIAHVWIDVEGYIRNNELKNQSLFLPKEEFIEKANLYEISSELYSLPEGYPLLFEEIGKNLSSQVTAYLIGGENMRIKGLKSRTKDIDIVVETKEDYELLMNAFTRLGYTPKGNVEFSTEDLRLYPSIILQHTNRSRIDLYTKKILRKLSLSSHMISRSNLVHFGNLKLGILCNEDVFLLKAVTSREGDIQDMATLVRMNYVGNNEFQQRTFGWDIVWEEIRNQENENNIQTFTEIIADNIEYLSEQTGIIPPFETKLQRYALDIKITSLLRGGKISLKQLVTLLMDDDNTEQTLRNRIDALVKNELVKKESTGKDVIVSLIHQQTYNQKDLKVTGQTLDDYLQWRFRLLEPSTSTKYEIVSQELNAISIDTIGKLDNIIIKTLDAMQEYANVYHSKIKLRQIGATRLCIGLHNPTLGKNSNSVYYISNPERFLKFVNG